MSKTQAEREAAARYNTRMDQIAIRVPKGDRDRYKQYAEAHGESLTGMIVRLIEKEMEVRP